MENIRILYLDDEVQNLHAFKATFRKFFHIHCASNKQEALAILESYKIQVFFVDQRMPQLTGIDFIQEVHSRFPDIINVLVTGCMEDVEFHKEIASHPEIFRFVKKPWNDDEILSVIELAFKDAAFLEKKTPDYKSFE